MFVMSPPIPGLSKPVQPQTLRSNVAVAHPSLVTEQQPRGDLLSDLGEAFGRHREAQMVKEIGWLMLVVFVMLNLVKHG